MYEIKGRQNKTICVDGGSIKITRKTGLLASKREKSLLIRNITSIDVKKPGFAFAGYIHLDVAGGNTFNNSFKVSGGTVDAAQDENSIMFSSSKDYKIALQIKEYIENYSA